MKSEGELAEYCRAKAILPEQVQQWREACEQANEPENKLSALAAVVHPGAKQQIRQLERELRRSAARLFRQERLIPRMIDRIRDLFDVDDGRSDS